MTDKVIEQIIFWKQSQRKENKERLPQYYKTMSGVAQQPFGMKLA